MNARYLTRAAEITGDHQITVDATFTRNGENTAECRGCGDKYSIHMYDSKTREWAQAHAETCRAMPAALAGDGEKLEAIRYTADVVVTTTDGHVLLIERGWDPHKGQWALPGGHVDPGETSRAAAARELAEEAGVYATGDDLVAVGTFDRPDRDPRGRYVTAAYHLTVLPGTPIEAGDDATKARWWPLNDLPPLAFDHADIIRATAAAVTV